MEGKNEQKAIKEHISMWVDIDALKECRKYFENTKCKNQSEYICKAIKFYNEYQNGQNCEELIENKVMNRVEKAIKNSENRTARLLFKQAVEVAKIFWLPVKELDIDYEDVDELHADCVEEVKKLTARLNIRLGKIKNELIQNLKKILNMRGYFILHFRKLKTF